ncbi:flavin-containing monooxygenase [Pseudomonas putida]|jgi:cyclohexanone monooxygenase|uniref:flavin-containing monooxygenase n=1 Tax=Pseudomonas TaxID=286 RepID=UPI0015737203|nr:MULTISPECIES: NAD(P)/FAD-dependent oxidoreductase [Pseudomonas]MBG6128093.1 cation diffusion facilitator CzcD-associated flavoprotein CzcO [Pseudomonas sp. M2]NSX19141.1 NAD(P)/FAD-dependent oxidoreductase [Pseudomonas putida]HDS1743969.1 NAD(P)/FAD-dependent oxidoreductase [Pseudomonas putida]
MTSTVLAKRSVGTDVIHYDAIVIGAGFGGIYMLKKLRDELGLKVRAFDKAGGIGGTWFWNRYPGALSDSESFVYCFSWDRELCQEWDFSSRYLTQPQILSYLNHVVDRHDLRRDIQLETGITQAVFDEDSNRWLVTADDGHHYSAKYLVTALGLLSATNVPKIKGLDQFKGHMYHTANWPEDAALEGKRVGVIGTGSTGCQVITAIAPAVGHLTVFQRSAQYTVPVGNGPVSREYVEDIKRNYDEIWKEVRSSRLAFGFAESDIPTMSVDAAERKAIFQRAWDFGGGFRYMFQTFNDIAVNEEANIAAQDFVREKIAEIVKDPETARKLMPRDLYAKRPLCDSGYYATFNRPNVSLVDVKANPIEEITAKGIRTADGVEHELDVLVFATGFDAVDGNYKRIDIRGRGDVSMKDHWADGPSSYLSVATANFPNMFMILGPNGPFTNLPPTIETEVEWVSDLIGFMEENELACVEPTAQSEQEWGATCQAIADQTLFAKTDSWIFGANIPGKSNKVYFYMGGLGAFGEQLAAVKNDDYRGFKFKAVSVADTPVQKALR